MCDDLAVTSFSAKGFEEYGRLGLYSILEGWPGKVVAYYEHVIPEFPSDARLEWRDLMKDDELMTVLDWAGQNPALQGIMPDGVYNYNCDLYKFCRKVFAVTHAGASFKGRMFWLDADIRITKQIPAEFLEALLKDCYTVYLGRKKYHSECGFVGYDTRHKIHADFMSTFRSIFMNGAVLSLPGFHDCWAYDYCLSITKAPRRNLSKEANGACAPMASSVLNHYMIHLKGPRKAGEKTG